MENEIIKNEITSFFGRMGFGEDLESVEIHEGASSRFSVYLRGPRSIQEETEEGPVQDEDAYLWNQRISPARMLIGERGGNLSFIEYLLKKVLRRKYNQEVKFTLDINDYRMKRLEDLKQDVKAAAKEVRLYKKEVPLRPMSSFERRIVHLLLAEYPDITTESIGQEPNRMVVIKPYP